MEIAVILGLILINGILSMSEIALVSARKSKLESESKKGNKSASTALKLSNDPDRFLSTIQIGITLIGIITGLYSGKAFAAEFAVILSKIRFLEPYSIGVAQTIIVIAVTYLTLVLGELVPKRLGMSRPEGISKILARPMYALSHLTSPFVWLLSKSTGMIISVFGIKDDDNGKVTEEEIKAIVKEGYDDGEVQEVEHNIVERVFNLGDRDIDSIMTHRSDLVCLDVADNKDQIRAKVIENMHDIYPVISGNMDNLQGVVYLRDLFAKIDSRNFSLQNIINPAQFLPENQSVYAALEQFKKANVKYGFIINEFGDVEGIITLTDILEALVGQVNDDEDDAEITIREDGSLLVDGQCSFYNFLGHLDMEYLYAEHDYNTISGLILEILGHIPVTGEKLSWREFDFEIIDMDGARIDKLLVTVGKSDVTK